MSFLDVKSLVLAVLVLQNTCLVLLMKFTRARSGVMYLASVAVASDEAMKLALCLVMLSLPYLSSGGRSLAGLVVSIRNQVYPSLFEFSRMAVPAMCYAVQKNFLYLAVSNLDAAVFQVAYQGKILTTALFAYLILDKRISNYQTLALLILIAGVSCVQLSSMTLEARRTESAWLGLASVAVACCTSGFASIYFEWVLKRSGSGVQPSLWVRNFQLTFFALLAAVLGAVFKDGHVIREGGLFQGFDWVIWLVVFVEAFGGIVVGFVVKYADNILKNFATAVSIVTSTVVSCLFFEFRLTTWFMLGSCLVLAAVWLYTSPLAQLKHSKIEDVEVGLELGSQSQRMTAT